MVTVCPGGQLLLTCERMSGSVLFWDISVPCVAGTTPQRIVTIQGVLLSPDFKIGFTEFNVTRTSESPLISQLLINNVTNGSTIYCSEDGDENNAPMIAVNIKYKGMIKKNDDKLFHNFIIGIINFIDEFLRSMDLSLNVTMHMVKPTLEK